MATTMMVSMCQVRESIKDAYPSVRTTEMLSIVRTIDDTDERARIDELLDELDVCLDSFAEAYVDVICKGL